MVDLGVQLGLVQKSGSWFSMGETRIGQGRDAARQYLKENPDVAEKLEEDIRANAYKLMPSTPSKPVAAPSVTAAPASAVSRPSAGREVDVSAEDFEDADL
jgi:recombination protein RecA